MISLSDAAPLLQLWRWAAVIAVHELGHYLAFRAARLKPTIRLAWWGISIGENCIMRATPLQAARIALAGVGAGLMLMPFLLPSHDQMFVYLLMCMLDFSVVISMLSFKKEFLRKPLVVAASARALEQLKIAKSQGWLK